jgi:ADP-heptose:LPS heptosyltransferase
VITDEFELPEYDFHTALMSLALAFGTRLRTIPGTLPYLGAAPDTLQLWQDRLRSDQGRLKVGIVWAGNPAFAAARSKTCPVEQLGPLLAMEAVSFFSLQKGDAASDAASLGQECAHFLDFTEHLHDFGETAALISELDLVITVDTAVAHLAGAMGKPTWVLLPFSADWRWLVGREDSPWYPSVRLFRQGRAGDWEGLITRVVIALQEMRPAAVDQHEEV